MVWQWHVVSREQLFLPFFGKVLCSSWGQWQWDQRWGERAGLSHRQKDRGSLSLNFVMLWEKRSRRVPPAGQTIEPVAYEKGWGRFPSTILWTCLCEAAGEQQHRLFCCPYPSAITSACKGNVIAVMLCLAMIFFLRLNRLVSEAHKFPN